MLLEKILKKLLISNPFWGLFLMGINKRYSNEIDTLCIKKSGISLELLINENFFNSLNSLEQIAVLIHELHHIAYGHMFLYDSFNNKELFNISADLEVNCYIDNLPNCAILPKQFELPNKKGTKWYYENLKKEGNIQTIDCHNSWKEFSGLFKQQKELIKSQIEDNLERVADCIERNRGTIPNSIKEILKKIKEKKKPIYDWKSHFRRLLGTQIETSFKKTYKRKSKRFLNSPGVKLKRKVKILVAVDTSGSISEKDLKDFFIEINNIYKSGALIDIIEFDSIIQNKWEYKNNKSIIILGRGGTDFNPPINYYFNNKKEYTTFVIFTDGCAPVDNLKIPKELIWIICSNGKNQNYQSKTIYIKD